MESAKNESYFWALYNAEDTMNVIRSADEKCRIKYELRDKRQFSGSLLCRNMKDGEYKFPFIIYREYAKNGDSRSMANDGFEHPVHAQRGKRKRHDTSEGCRYERAVRI